MLLLVNYALNNIGAKYPGSTAYIIGPGGYREVGGLRGRVLP